MAALLPTLITLWLLVWAWDFLWDSLGRHLIWGIKRAWFALGQSGLLAPQSDVYIGAALPEDWWVTRLLGVLLAVVLVYIVGVLVGNFIGRTAWRLAEMGVMRIPLVRAIYPAVKQVTDFLLSDRRAEQFAGSRVVAVQPHESGIWSIGLVTGPGLRPISESVGDEMVTVFIPSTPTAFSGYTVVAPRRSLLELPLTVEEAMRLLVTGGVLAPETLPASSPSMFPGAAERAAIPYNAAPPGAGVSPLPPATD